MTLLGKEKNKFLLLRLRIVGGYCGGGEKDAELEFEFCMCCLMYL